jgi:hypothetical protein
VNTGAPLLNDYDATPSEDVNNPIKDDGEPRIRMPIFWGDATVPEDVDNPLKKDENSRIRIPIARRHRIIAWICFIIYGIFINLTIFYSVSYLGDQSTILKEKLTNTISKTYGVVAETYEEMKNPGSTEEVAALMTEFYELLAEMGYYEPEKIDRAPHANPSINKNYAAELGFSPKAIEMLEKLPYLNNDHDFWWSHGDGDAEFLLFGTFIDFRVDENLQGNEDPLYALWGQGDDGPKGFDEDGGKYMRPDYLCLSMLGNHGTTMILNVKNFKLWTIDQEMGSADPALKDVQAKGDDRNYNSLDNYPSRAANLVLNDYMQKFRDLEWMPGGLYNGNWDGDNYAKLYRENGWPSKFNRTAFMIAREQWEEDERMRWDAEQPFQEVAKYENWLSSSLWRIENNQKAISDVDAGKEIPNNQPDRPDRFADREKYRQELLDEVNSTTASLPKLLQDLEAARETLKGIDPAVRKAREDRIAKYGH